MEEKEKDGETSKSNCSFSRHLRNKARTNEQVSIHDGTGHQITENRRNRELINTTKLGLA